MPRVRLEAGKNIGRNSTRPETDVKNIIGGAKLGRAAASRQLWEPKRKEKDFHDMSQECTKLSQRGWDQFRALNKQSPHFPALSEISQPRQL